MEYLQQVLEECCEMFITEGKKLKETQKHSAEALTKQQHMMNISCLFNLLSKDRVGTQMWLQHDYEENWQEGARMVFKFWLNAIKKENVGVTHLIHQLLECLDKFIALGKQLKPIQEMSCYTQLDLQRKMMDIAYTFDMLSRDHIGTIIREKYYDLEDWETEIRAVVKEWLDAITSQSIEQMLPSK